MAAKQASEMICVLGLGYIGLPTASMFATHGHKVHGVDTEPQVINTLKKGEVHIEEPGLSTIVKAALSSKNLSVGGKPVPSDVFIIAVPTPCIKSKGATPKADLSYVRSAVQSILPHLKKGNLVILESTSPPGTSRDVIIPLIEKTGLKAGKDVGVAYCPERVIPGKALQELVGNDRVVGAIDQECAARTRGLYKSFVSGEIFLTDLTVAEMIKIVENTYRDVNIAFANQIAVLCEKLGINVGSVIKIANRHPRVNVHKPGPGVGGHCISVDPWFLVEQFPKEADFIRKARETNDRMPQHVADRIAQWVKGKKKAKVAILGLSYKANVDDTRESPALEVIELLQEQRPDIELAVFDPHVHLKRFPKQGLLDVFRDADLAVILTAHDDFQLLDPQRVGDVMRTRALYDTHQSLPTARWKAAGFDVHVLGVGHEV
jgi:UDP-N-acetyl-D-mannosaminuronic acid dehydrogenase